MTDTTPKEQITKLTDRMIAAPKDENGNLTNLADALYALHELTAVTNAMMSTQVGTVKLHELLDKDAARLYSLTVGAMHELSCTPERKEEAQAAADLLMKSLSLAEIMTLMFSRESTPGVPEPTNQEEANEEWMTGNSGMDSFIKGLLGGD